MKQITNNENISSRFPIGLYVLIQYVKNACKRQFQKSKSEEEGETKENKEIKTKPDKTKSVTIEEIVNDLEEITSKHCDLKSILKINIIEK